MRSATEPGEKNARGTAVPGSEIPAQEVRAELDKILASPSFAGADRQSRFLRYVVEETLEGQPDKLKETLIGIEVFGRKTTYDPRIDAVVRTEAIKVRTRLNGYYESDGQADAVRIDIPKGGYVATFSIREEPAPPEPAASPPDPVTASPWKSIAAGVIMTAVLAGSIWIAARKDSRPEGVMEMSSIAVLPFEDLSPAHDQEYFCDGMTEEIIDALTKINGFRVVSRTSSFAFKGKRQDIREIGKTLNVGAVLEGSVRKSGDKLRITAQLNSVADGYHLWSETYERELRDVFSVQDEISRAIVDTLQVKLTGAHNATRANVGPANIEAYDLYLKGRYHWGRWRTEGAQKGLQYFNQAIAKDPSYAAAYAGLADSYCWLGFFGALTPNAAMPKAREAALKAIQLDDSLPSAHASLGYVKALYDFDFTGAEQEFKRAIELNPGLPDGHFGYGMVVLAPRGQLQEALKEMKLARDLDPLSLAENTYLGLLYQFQGDSEKAISYYKRALELDPNFWEAHYSLASAYLHQGNFAAFDSELARMQGDPAERCRTSLMRAIRDAAKGHREQALAEIQPWLAPKPGVFVRPTIIANVYSALGDSDQAIAWLQRAYAERDGMLAYINKEHSYVKYHADPRYQEILRKIGLAQ